ISLLLSKRQFETINACRKFHLAFRYLMNINITDNANLDVIAHAKHYGLVHLLVPYLDALPCFEHDIYLIFLARMHGVCNDAVSDKMLDCRDATRIRYPFLRKNLDDCPVRQLLREVARTGNYRLWIRART